MATQTPNLNLVLPDYADKADIGVVNDNFKKIDDFSGGGKVEEWLDSIQEKADESLAKIAQDATSYLNNIQKETNESLNEIENKAKNSLESIPDDYEVLAGEVNSLKDHTADIMGFCGIVEEIKLVEEKGWVWGGYYNTRDNSVVDLAGDTHFEVSGSRGYLKIPYTSGEIYHITGSGGAKGFLWSLIAEDGTILSSSGNGTGVGVTAEDYVLQYDKDCTLLVQVLKSATHSVRKEVVILNAKEELKKPVEVKGWTFGGYYDLSGDTVDLNSDANFVTEVSRGYLRVDYKSGDVYRITGSGGSKARLWAFVASDGTILDVAKSNAIETGYVLTYVADCTLIVEVSKYASYALFKEEHDPLPDAMARVNGRISAIENTSYVFGNGINCDYETPTIPAFVDPGEDQRLSYFYGLYDALVAAYPEYVQKIDCDAEVTAAGITKPDELSNYPTYMYKFSPAFAPSTSSLTGATISKPITLFVTTGTHGELMAVWDMYQIMKLICESWQTDENLEALRWESVIYIMPCSTPYAVDKNIRVNHNSVNINRNCPTAEWAVAEEGTTDYTGPSAASEYETKLFMHYLDALKPHVYIDHHNSYRTSKNTSWWGFAVGQHLVNIIATSISDRSRKLRKRLTGIYPEGNWVIDGYATDYTHQGDKCQYGYEQGIHTFTYETNASAFYENGVNVPDGTEAYASLPATIAVDGFLNFVLLALKELAKRPYLPAD